MSFGGGSRVAARRAPHPSLDAVPTAGAREPQEHVVARLRRSARSLTGPVLLFLLICGGTGYLWNRLPSPWLNSALPFVALVAVVAFCLVPLLLWMNRVTIVTTKRLITRRGFVVRESSEFVLGRGSTMTLRRGPLQLLAGSGDVIVHAGAQGTMILRDVPHAKLVHQAVSQLVEQSSAQAGVTSPVRRASA
jgi:membrane protein YdbS with pleckstrin-like domain